MAHYYKELRFFHEKDVFPWVLTLPEQDQHLYPYNSTANITRPDGLLQCSSTANYTSLYLITRSNILCSLWKKIFLDQPALRSCVVFRAISIHRKPLNNQQESLTLAGDIV